MLSLKSLLMAVFPSFTPRPALPCLFFAFILRNLTLHLEVGCLTEQIILQSVVHIQENL